MDVQSVFIWTQKGLNDGPLPFLSEPDMHTKLLNQFSGYLCSDFQRALLANSKS